MVKNVVNLISKLQVVIPLQIMQVFLAMPFSQKQLITTQ
jgi:hypothetical protein